MKLDTNDPRLTAFVLGELPEEERREIEEAMAQCDESRALVESIAATTKLLEDELGSAAPAVDEGLGEARRAALEAKIGTKDGAKGAKVIDLDARRRRRLKVIVPLAAAASVLIAVAIGGVGMMSEKGAPSSSSRTTQVSASEVADEETKSSTSRKLSSETLARLKRMGARRLSAGGGKNQYGERGPRGYVRGQALADGRFAAGDSPDPSAKLKGHRGELEKRGDNAEGGETDSLIPRSLGSSTSARAKRERYAPVYENPFRAVKAAPLSTFSVDVDTASYSNVRRFLSMGQHPPRGAVRLEELINYFDYEYGQPQGQHPFAVNVATSRAPWRPAHYLARIALQGRKIAAARRPASNLVFLLDVSGSMSAPNKLPLLKRALGVLLERLDARDRVAIVVYAGASGLVLQSTRCDGRGKRAVRRALERLSAGGSTNGGAGISLAYSVAARHLIDGGVNRVILATDGDFNVGTTNNDELVSLVRERAKKKVFLSVLGFGMGNYQDARLETLANKGNGNYAYIDTVYEARKVLGEQLAGTLITIAKDVKIQVEFNPRFVAAYRLIGYENRMLRARDFADDKKDAGEIGAGHQVTALYELVPAGAPIPNKPKLRYQPSAPSATPEPNTSGELLTVKLRYKLPEGTRSVLVEKPIAFAVASLAQTDNAFRFASAVAWFGMTLRGSSYAGDEPRPWPAITRLARAAEGADRHGYRKEFLQLVQRAARIGSR